MREPSPVVTLPKGWQRERVQRLARICRCIDAGRTSGKRIHEILVWFAWRWKGCFYKCDSARPIRFGYGTLMRCYYAWRSSGGDVVALALRYRCGNQKVSTSKSLKLSKLCLAPEAKSFSAAYRGLIAPGATESAYRYAMLARLRAALAALLANRRRGQALERAARRLLQEVTE